MICFGCLISCADFLRFPWDVLAHVLISCDFLGNVLAHLLISCDFLGMSWLMCSFLVISLGCLSSRPHFLRFPLDVSAHVITQATQPGSHRVSPSFTHSLPHSVTQPISHSEIQQSLSHSVSQSVSHSLTHFAPAINQASEGGGEAGSVGVQIGVGV